MTGSTPTSEAPRSPVRVETARPEHVEGMAACHIAAFPGEFLSLLGKGVLRALYRFCIDWPEGICLVTVDEQTGRVSGLVAGGNPALHSRFVRKHAFRLAATALCKAMVHGRVRRRLGEHLAAGLRAMGRKLHLLPANGKRPAPPEDPPGTWSNLLSVCARPAWRRRGLGRALMEAFRAESARRGYKTMRLSVHNDNAAAIALYKKSGWEPILVVPQGTYFRRSVKEPT